MNYYQTFYSSNNNTFMTNSTLIMHDRTFYYTDKSAELFDTYNNTIESIKEMNLDFSKANKIIENILNYTKDHFRESSVDLKYYNNRGFILSKYNITKLNNAFTEIKKLDPKRFFYYILSLGENEDTILSFRDTEPDDEHFEKDFASNYFDVDEVWSKELRLLKHDK